jgi:hypothetical protein
MNGFTGVWRIKKSSWAFSINEGEIPNIHMQFKWWVVPIMIYLRLGHPS